MNIFSKLKISGKLVAAFAAIILVFVLAATVIFGNLGRLSDAAESNARSVKVAALNADMLATVIQEENALRGYAMLARAEMLDEYEASRKAFDAAADEFQGLTALEDQRARAKALREEVGRLRDGRFAQVIKLASRPETRAQAQQMAGEKQLAKVREITGEIAKRQNEVMAEQRTEMSAANSAATTTLFAGSTIAILCAIGLGWLLSRAIAKPLVEMTTAMSSLAAGNVAVEVPAAGRADEIGSMANALLVFRDAARAKQAADASAQAAAAEQKQLFDALESGLGKLAQGDLTSEIREQVSPNYEAVKANYNSALANLRDLIGSVVQSAAAIQTGSGEIAQASEDLARRTEGNAASLEETSAAVTQMDGRLKATAEAANRTVERADSAISTVSGGRCIADEAVQAMTRVAESAKGIDSVIEGLDKIAFQTRVLAMNAAVEAGRAGEAGRGFAVVADLVSALAMRAEEEAGRARDQLTATQTDIVAAVEMVQKVDGALADISSGVSEVHTLLGQMAADNQAQSSAITQISTAITTMDQSTQQNAAMVEQTSAAARNLSGEVSTLSEEAAKFVISTGQAARAPAQARSRTAAAASARPQSVAKSATKIENYVSPVKPLQITTANGHDDTDWASF